MKLRLFLSALILLSTSLSYGQVRREKKDKPVKKYTAPAKANVTVVWKDAYNVFIYINGKQYEFEAKATKQITIDPGLVKVEVDQGGKRYSTKDYPKIDAGSSVLELSRSGDYITYKYESERLRERRRLEARRKKEAEELRQKQAAIKQVKAYIDKAYDYIGKGQCSNAQTYYNKANSGVLPVSGPELSRLKRSISACKNNNMFSNLKAEAENLKRRGELSASLRKYRSALSYKSNDYYVKKAIQDIESDMRNAREYERLGDAAFDQNNYQKAVEFYTKAHTIWSKKYGLSTKKAKAQYQNNKARGKHAMDTKDYDAAIRYFESAKRSSHSSGDAELNRLLKKARYGQDMKRGDRAYRNDDYNDAYNYYKDAQEHDDTPEIEDKIKQATRKMFEEEWNALVLKDNISAYENFLKRWTIADEKKKNYIYKRLYELNFSAGKRNFFQHGYYSGYMRNAKSWLQKYDPKSTMKAECRTINSYLSYSPAQQGFSLQYPLPVMVGNFKSETFEDFRNVNNWNYPINSGQVARSDWYFTNRFYGTLAFNHEALIPTGSKFLALPFGFKVSYLNNTIQDIAMTEMVDSISENVKNNPQFDGFEDTLKNYKGVNKWYESQVQIEGNVGINISAMSLQARMLFAYNIHRIKFNPYARCTSCGGQYAYKNNYLSSGIQVIFKNRLTISYHLMNKLFRAENMNPNNKASLLRGSIIFGDPDKTTRFSLMAEYFTGKIYAPPGPSGSASSDQLIQKYTNFRLFPTLTIQF